MIREEGRLQSPIDKRPAIKGSDLISRGQTRSDSRDYLMNVWARDLATSNEYLSQS